jgi:WD40 repeat protein
MSQQPGPGKSLVRRGIYLAVALAGLLAVSGMTSPGQEPRKPTIVIPLPGLVTSLAYSPDGKLLAVAEVRLDLEKLGAIQEAPGIVRLYNPATAEVVATLKGHPTGVWVIAFSDDGHTLGSAGLDGAVKLWDVASRKEEVSAQLDEGVGMLAFSPDLRTVATGSREQGTIKVWDIATGEMLADLGAPPAPEGRRVNTDVLAFSPDGKALAVGRFLPRFAVKDGGVRDKDLRPERERTPAEMQVWDLPTRKVAVEFTRPDATGPALAWSPDGITLAYRFVAEVGPPEPLRLWNAKTRKDRPGPGDFFPSGPLAWSPDGKRLGGVSATDVLLWDTVTDERHKLMRPDGGSLTALCFSPDGKTMATGDTRGIVLWDIARARKPIDTGAK